MICISRGYADSQKFVGSEPLDRHDIAVDYGDRVGLREAL